MCQSGVFQEWKRVFQRKKVYFQRVRQVSTQVRRFHDCIDERNSIVAAWNTTDLEINQTAEYDPNGVTRLYDKQENILCDDGHCPNINNLPFGFTSALCSEVTGLIHMRARWYSPRLAQFISPDPLGYIDSYNLYAYAGFDPINYWDPYGLSKDGFGVESAPDMNPRHPSEEVAQHNAVDFSFDKRTSPGSLLPPDLRRAPVAFDVSVYSKIIAEQWPGSSSSDLVFVNNLNREMSPMSGGASGAGPPSNSRPPRFSVTRISQSLGRVGSNVSSRISNSRWNPWGARAQRVRVLEDSVGWQGNNVRVSNKPIKGGDHDGYTKAVSDLPGGMQEAMGYFRSFSGRNPRINNLSSKRPTDTYFTKDVTIEFRPNSTTGGPAIEIYNHRSLTYEKIHFK